VRGGGASRLRFCAPNFSSNRESRERKNRATAATLGRRPKCLLDGCYWYRRQRRSKSTVGSEPASRAADLSLNGPPSPAVRRTIGPSMCATRVRRSRVGMTRRRVGFRRDRASCDAWGCHSQHPTSAAPQRFDSLARCCTWLMMDDLPRRVARNKFPHESLEGFIPSVAGMIDH
jgi:hypothetical protein